MTHLKIDLQRCKFCAILLLTLRFPWSARIRGEPTLHKREHDNVAWMW